MPGRRRPAAPAGPDQTASESDDARAIAFQRIYDEWFEDVGRWMRALGARSPDVPDLVQEVFIIAYRRLSHFDQRNVAGWLYQIARRRMRDYRRRSWIRHLFTARTVSTFEHSLAAGPDARTQLERRQQAALLERLLDALPEEQRAAFVLFEIEGCSGAAIAQLQQVTVNTVWGRIHKARKKLQARLLTLKARASPKT